MDRTSRTDFSITSILEAFRRGGTSVIIILDPLSPVDVNNILICSQRTKNAQLQRQSAIRAYGTREIQVLKEIGSGYNGYQSNMLL